MGAARRRKRKNSSSVTSAPGILAFVLFAVCVVLYLNTLGHGFVFDDGALILQNSAVTELRWGQMLGVGSYRPVRTLTYALNYLLGGTDPFGYHLFNLLLHGINAVLLFRLLQLWSGTVGAAFAGALIFAVHPVQTAAVAYVSGRKDLLATCFILAALICFAHYRGQGGRARLAAALGLGLLAMLSKEVALVFPGLLLLVVLCLPGRVSEGSVLSRLTTAIRRFALPISAAALLAAAGLYHAVSVSQATRMSGFWGGSVAANLGTSLKLFPHYLKLVLWPHPLIADYKGEVLSLSSGFTEPATLLSAVILLAFLWLAARQLGTRPLLGLGMGWFFLTLLPVLQIIPFHELAADHFLYLPMVGTAAAVTHLFTWEVVSKQRPAWGVLGALVLLFSAMTVDRNRDWKDQMTLWEVTYAQAPGSHRALTNLGQFYFRRPETRAEGLEMTKRAVAMIPDDPVALSNLGAMEFILAREAAGRREPGEAQRLAEQAREHLEAALKERRADGSILTNLGSVENLLALLAEQRGDIASTRQHRETAVRRFKQALARDSRKEIQAAWYNLALAYLDLREYSLAASCLQRFLHVNPGHADATLRLGFCEVQLEDYPAAIRALQVSLRTRPSPQAFDLLAQAHQGMGDTQQAIAFCRQGLELFPDVEFLQRRLDALEQASDRRYD